MLRLVGEKSQSVCVSEMKDGDIAIITMWTTGFYIGRIVQRYGDYLLVIGAEAGLGWGKYFKISISYRDVCQVRILKKGETLIVE